MWMRHYVANRLSQWLYGMIRCSVRRIRHICVLFWPIWITYNYVDFRNCELERLKRFVGREEISAYGKCSYTSWGNKTKKCHYHINLSLNACYIIGGIPKQIVAILTMKIVPVFRSKWTFNRKNSLNLRFPRTRLLKTTI